LEERLKKIKNNERIGTEPMHKYYVFLEKKDWVLCEIGAWA